MSQPDRIRFDCHSARSKLQPQYYTPQVRVTVSSLKVLLTRDRLVPPAGIVARARPTYMASFLASLGTRARSCNTTPRSRRGRLTSRLGNAAVPVQWDSIKSLLENRRRSSCRDREANVYLWGLESLEKTLWCSCGEDLESVFERSCIYERKVSAR